MTLAHLDDSEIFVAVIRTIQKQEGIPEMAAYPTADAVAQRLSSSWSSVDRDSVTSARRRRIAEALKKSIQIKEQTDEAIHAAMKALGELEAQEAEAPPPSAIFAPTGPTRSSASSSFIKTVVYWYREDRPFLVFMGINVVILVLTLRLLVNIVS